MTPPLLLASGGYAVVALPEAEEDRDYGGTLGNRILSFPLMSRLEKGCLGLPFPALAGCRKAAAELQLLIISNLRACGSECHSEG